MSKKKGKMRSKTKIGVRKPPLSAIDWFIYIMGFSLALIVGVVVFPFGFWLNDLVVFHDPTLVAVTKDALDLLLLIPGMGWLFLAFGFLGRQFSAKQPIFGNPNITYGAFPWKKDLFPLFGPYSKQRSPKPLTHQERQKRKERLVTAGLCGALWLLCLAYGGATGACLRDDMSVTVFQVSHSGFQHVYTREEFEALELSVHYHSGGKSSRGYWDLSVEIEMEDGVCRSFCTNDFDRNDPDRYAVVLETLTKLKGLFPAGAVSIEGEGKIDHIIEKYEYDATQARMLRELFEVES